MTESRSKHAGVQHVPLGNQDRQFVPAQGIGTRDVVDPASRGFRDLRHCPGQVGHMHRALHVVCEEDVTAGIGNRVMNMPFMPGGTDVSNDQ